MVVSVYVGYTHLSQGNKGLNYVLVGGVVCGNPT